MKKQYSSASDMPTKHEYLSSELNHMADMAGNPSSGGPPLHIVPVDTILNSYTVPQGGTASSMRANGSSQDEACRERGNQAQQEGSQMLNYSNGTGGSEEEVITSGQMQNTILKPSEFLDPLFGDANQIFLNTQEGDDGIGQIPTSPEIAEAEQKYGEGPPGMPPLFPAVAETSVHERLCDTVRSQQMPQVITMAEVGPDFGDAQYVADGLTSTNLETIRIRTVTKDGSSQIRENLATPQLQSRLSSEEDTLIYRTDHALHVQGEEMPQNISVDISEGKQVAAVSSMDQLGSPKQSKTVSGCPAPIVQLPSDNGNNSCLPPTTREVCSPNCFPGYSAALALHNSETNGPVQSGRLRPIHTISEVHTADGSGRQGRATELGSHGNVENVEVLHRNGLVRLPAGKVDFVQEVEVTGRSQLTNVLAWRQLLALHRESQSASLRNSESSLEYGEQEEHEVPFAMMEQVMPLFNEMFGAPHTSNNIPLILPRADVQLILERERRRPLLRGNESLKSGKTYVCQHQGCSEKFGFKSNLTRHVHVGHKGCKVFKCWHCPKEFLDFRNIKRHVQVRKVQS